MRFDTFIFFSLILIFNSCNPVPESNSIKNINSLNFNTLTLKNNNNNYTAVIEIPAGTNKKYEYNYSTNSFECEVIDNKPRTIKYLPYPGNYGFIPGTYMTPSKGGDGDALDVLILSESKSQGSVLEIKPIAILKLHDQGEEDHKIIAMDLNDDNRFITDSLTTPIKNIIQTWFCNYKGPNKMEFIAWGNQFEAIEEIKKWDKNSF